MLRELKQQVILRLGVYLGYLALVRDYPEAPRDSGFPIGTPQLSVGYAGSRYGTPIRTLPILQDRTAEISVFVEAQDLNNDTLVLPILDKINDVLTGFQPLIRYEAIQDGIMYPVSDAIVQAENKTWARELRYAVPVKHLQIKV